MLARLPSDSLAVDKNYATTAEDRDAEKYETIIAHQPHMSTTNSE